MHRYGVADLKSGNMRKIIYYVAVSLDGFIAGPNDDISGFTTNGSGVDKYFSDLNEFDTVIMGRNTYEFGYKYGLIPGQPAYPHMEHYIFSNHLHFEKQHKKVKVRKPDLEEIIRLKESKGTDIYLCGGGQFAGWLLDHRQIDLLKLKLNPFIQGEGVPLFGKSCNNYKTRLLDSTPYEDGLQIMTYEIIYG